MKLPHSISQRDLQKNPEKSRSQNKNGFWILLLNIVKCITMDSWMQ